MASQIHQQFSFRVADYVFLGGVVFVSMAIGLYYALTGGRQKTMSEYLVGNRQMQVLPVALSLLVSFQSAVLMVGLPAEMYVYGTMFWLFVLSAISANVISAIFVVPLFQPLKLTSAYEYLELRFKSRFVRRMGSAIGILGNTWYCGVVLYAPALILEAVSGTPVWTSIIVLSISGIIYTSIGGYKAVIWADVFQFVIMFTGMLAIIIKGSLAVGGFGEMWRLAEEGGRVKFFNFNPDPRIRNTFWCLVVGGTIKKFGYNLSQSAIQRMSSMENVKKAQQMVLLAIPGFVLFGTLACLEGLLAYAYFAKSGCDILEAKIIKSSNQIIPYFVMVLFESTPGLPGLFLSSVFCAALSSLSSCLNGISAMVSEDFIKPLQPFLPDWKRTITAKITVVVFGLLSIGVSFLASHTRGPMYEIASILLSSFGGALTGLFLLGALSSTANAMGATGGGVLGFGFCFWVSLGGAFSNCLTRAPGLESPGTQNCSSFLNNTASYVIDVSTVSTTHIYNLTSASPLHDVVNQTLIANDLDSCTQSLLIKLYSISYMWLYLLGVVVTMVTGIVISFVTGGHKQEPINPAYLMNVIDRIYNCLPLACTDRLLCHRKKVNTSYSSSSPSNCTPEEKDSTVQLLSVKFEDKNTCKLMDS